MTASAPSLVGFWYAAGPADRPFDPDDPAFSIHVIVADDDAVSGCVTIRNGAGQRFPLARSLALDIAVPPPVAADNPRLRHRAADRDGSHGDKETGR
ncbi:hypothetical protein [Rubrimonas cliftonensis]|uniref:Uncharacterized protein n=1 Tax=Rubrimonas cliftonensis TaxID=89524 RepID=A0A1H4ETG5_9RHOB|nr:hypothetical protein [Rubrimonas cliftonensis]SEA87522.1 hypothetical protein SAMN05444370_11555 [Rubrimonas cliftonensis]